MTRCEWCGRHVRSSKSFSFSTDDAKDIRGVPDGPIEVHFCSAEHMDQWQAQHPQQFPNFSSHWPMEWLEVPLRIRLLYGAVYAVVIGFAIYGVVNLVLTLT